MYKISIKVKIQLRYPKYNLKNLPNADYPSYLFFRFLLKNISINLPLFLFAFSKNNCC